MSDREASLTFALEETVWFQKGQEVDELISISLDPHISILEEEEYVILDGTLTLNGEYRHLPEAGEPEDPFGSLRKYVQSVEARSEEESVFFHQFPVNITIPRRRVPNPEELVIAVQSFDYELPQGNRLTIEADLDVFGLAADFPEVPNTSVEEESQESLALQLEESSEEEREEISITGMDTNEHVEEFSEVALEFVEEERIPVADVDEEEDDEDEEDEREELSLIEEEENPAAEIHMEEEESIEVIEAEPELYEPFFAEARKTPREEEDVRKEFNKLQQLIPQLPEFAMEALAELTREFAQKQDDPSPSSSHPYEAESSSPLFEEESQESSSSSPEQKVKKKKDKYQSISFADFFARKEEDASAKLRLCLVQSGDTLDRLADRYNISPQQILRANRLEPSADVHEGQVIYIPAKTQHRK